MKQLAFTFEGKQYRNRKEFCRLMHIDYSRLNSLINYRGLSLEEAAQILITERNKIIKAVTKPNTNKTDIEKVEPPKQNIEEPKPIVGKKEEVKSYKPIPTPIYFTVMNPAEIVKIVGDFQDHIKTINLIDFENVNNNHDLLDPNINESNALNIYFYNATIYSNDFYNKIKKSSNINVQVHIFECGKELVDHLITYYLGAIRINFPDLEYRIISKDLGFYPFINSLGSDKVKGVGRKYLEDPELRFKYSLCKYIVENDIFKNRKIVATHELDKFFGKFYNNEMSEDDIKALSDTLVKLKLATVADKGIYKWATFNLDEIKNFYNENR